MYLRLDARWFRFGTSFMGVIIILISQETDDFCHELRLTNKTLFPKPPRADSISPCALMF